jgi:hypothetical protein
MNTQLHCDGYLTLHVVLCSFGSRLPAIFFSSLSRLKIPTRTNSLHTIYCIIVIKCRTSRNAHKSKAKQEGSQKKIEFMYHHGLYFCFPRRTGRYISNTHPHSENSRPSQLLFRTEHTFSKLKLQRRLQLQTDPTTLLPLAALICVGAEHCTHQT